MDHVDQSAIHILVFFMDQLPTFTYYGVHYVICSPQTTFTVGPIFYTNIHLIQGSRATRNRVLLNVKEEVKTKRMNSHGLDLKVFRF